MHFEFEMIIITAKLMIKRYVHVGLVYAAKFYTEVDVK